MSNMYEFFRKHGKLHENWHEYITTSKNINKMRDMYLKLNFLSPKGGEIRDTNTLNLSRNIVSLQVLVDVSRFSPCVINLIRNKNICCGLKKCSALIG